MRSDKAISEVLGAIFLIGIVIVAIAVIGVSLISQTPSESSKYPKATTGTYCVNCEGNYEIVLKHEGGEAFPTKDTKLKVITNEGMEDPDEIFVYDAEPVECSLKTSQGGSIYSWDSLDSFGPGLIAKVIVNKDINDTEDDVPDGLVILYDNQTGPGGAGTQYFERVKNETNPSYNSDTGSEITTFQDVMKGNLVPNVKSDGVPDSEGYCTAECWYDNSLGLTLNISPCNGNAVITDGSGGSYCAEPANEFVGVGSGNFSYLKKNMGQPTLFLPNEEASLFERSFNIKFKNEILWKLGAVSSGKATCLEEGICDCDSQETCLWGYMFNDADDDGVRDEDETGFSSGSVNVIWKYKNQGQEVVQTSNITPSSEGLWKSECIQMSGWGINVTANLPSEFTTDDSYANYEEKMTGQDKKNPPELDFAVVVAPTQTPVPVGTLMPVDTGGVGAQLYTADNTTDVIVQFTYSDAWYDNVFKLFSPNSISLGSTKSVVAGQTWNLGKYTNGTELIFSDTADGKTYKSGPASRNPDSIVHGAVTYVSGNTTHKTYLVTFEDYYGGGDKDYNDVEFYVIGNIYTATATAVTPAPTTTPAPDSSSPTVSGVTASQNSWTKKVTIGWTASDNVGITDIEIRLSTDGGYSYPNIIRQSSWTTSANQVRTDSFEWTPNKNYSKAKFKVIAYDEAENAGSGVSSSIKIYK